MADVTIKQTPVANHNEPKAKRPYVRRLTDKRREQNRRAQKNYREKLKRKLEDLDGQTAAKTSRELDESGEGPALIQAPRQSLDEEVTPPACDDPPNVIDFDSILCAAGDLSLPSVSFASDFNIPFTYPSPSATRPPAASSKALASYNEVPKGADPLSLWQLHDHSFGTAYSPPPNDSATYMAGSLTAIPPTYDYMHQKARILHRPGQPTSISPNAFSLPSPKTNFLRLTSESNLSASLAIGLSLGISSTAYLEDHPSRFPFCTRHLWPGATFPQLAERGLPQATQDLRDHFVLIKRPLRPAAVQMYYSHPSYLDCIVFPRFRDKVVQASVEGRLDHVEFFIDLMHGGLVCWGSTSPSVTKRRRRRRIQDQVAWSTRSWEARRWFLEKWEWLCGTEEEEEAEDDCDGIWASSRWWWAVKGELDTDEDWSESDEEDAEYLKEASRIRRFEPGVKDDETEADCRY